MMGAPIKCLWAAMICLLGVVTAGAQTASPPAERIYDAPVDRVKQALQQLGASAGGKLPGLDGFVPADLEHFDRYERPYYQYRTEISASDTGHTNVRVQAKINAWYLDPTPGHSQYRSLPSNGRLESDLLDRLQEALEPAAALREPRPNAPANPADAEPIRNSRAVVPGETGGSSLPQRSDEAALLQQELEKLRVQRHMLETKSTDLTAQVAELDQDLHQQKSVSGLASVKRSGASIMSRLSYSGPVLFRARAEDEFEALARQGEWMQIRTGPASTGWIVADELSLPKGLVVPPVKEEASAPSAATAASNETQASRAGTGPTEKETPAAGTPASVPPELGFWISHEAVNTFSGDWGQLKGKKVLFVFVQSRGLLADMAADDRKLVYAKSVFTSRYKGANTVENSYEGVVVIFMGGKGGVAAATISDIQEWAGGRLSEEAFLKRCSLDPPAEFRGWNTPNPPANSCE